MLILINTIISFAILLGFIQFAKDVEFYKKLLSFFYIITNLTIVVLINFAGDMDFILDVIITLLLLEFLMIITFLSNKIKRNDDV
jgi:hypothetical protein